LLIGAWFLFVFAQTSNLNSGGTVHISRYALWLMPLALPLVAATAGWLHPRVPALLPVAGLFAVIAYGAYFLPSRAEQYMTYSPQAAFIMSRAPELYRPVPEIFYERHHHTDGGVLGSVASSDCRVILLHAAAPDIACPLSADETIVANRLLAGDWQAIWIIRPGPLGLGPGRVTGALAQP
ncbi:MAG: hypothetical protein M3509_03915, partial [Chloroflexota bacterium]|nr:hypothetical protein [Chloroflexota bacterium]